MGTTAFGQDVFSQLIWGARQSLIIAFAAGGIATVIAVIVGVAAAYLGGFTDGVLSTITDILLVIPIFPLFIVIAAYLHSAGPSRHHHHPRRPQLVLQRPTAARARRCRCETGTS